MSKIEIYDKCSGIGEVRVDVGTHTSDYECHVCSKCNGTGQIITTTYCYSVGYDYDDKILNKVSEKIINLIKSL